MKVINGKTKVWLSQWSDPEKLKHGGDNAIRQLTFANCDMSGGGYTYVGIATVVAEIVDEKTMVVNKVESLKKELQCVRAKAQKEVNDLEDKIQKLLAITNEVEAA